MKQENQKIRELAYVVVDTKVPTCSLAIIAVAGSRWQAKKIIGTQQGLIIVKKRFIEHFQILN